MKLYILVTDEENPRPVNVDSSSGDFYIAPDFSDAKLMFKSREHSIFFLKNAMPNPTVYSRPYIPNVGWTKTPIKFMEFELTLTNRNPE